MLINFASMWMEEISCLPRGIFGQSSPVSARLSVITSVDLGALVLKLYLLCA